MQEDRVSFFHQSIYSNLYLDTWKVSLQIYSSDIAWYIQTNLCEIFVVETVW